MELLVAMAILITVTMSAALMFRGIARAWRTGELRTERYQQARLLFDLLGRELSSSIANARFPMVGLPAPEGKALREDSQYDVLFFAGILPGRTGIVERGYWVDDEGSLRCHDEEPADGDYATGTSEPCGYDIAGLAFSYFDGTTWSNGWDAREAEPAGRLPKAVHVVLMLGRGRNERFETTIYVPTS